MNTQPRLHPSQSRYPENDRPVRVLLIDDEPAQTEAVAAQLGATGSFEIQSENSSIMGVEAARNFKPDVIILDICMPLLDGGDVSAALELDPELRNIEIIFCSSLVSPEEMSEDGIIISGGRIIMAKPVRVEKLVSCIQRRLAGQI